MILKYRPGDGIGLQSPSCVGRVIRVCTLADLFWWFYGLPPVDHVGIVGYKTPFGEGLYEALVETGAVECNPLRDQLRRYLATGCRVWHYPLAKPLNDEEAGRLHRWLDKQVGKPYDHVGALRARSLGCGWFRHLLPSRETLGNWFCSELDGAGLREVNRFHTRNVSEWAPSWFCAEEVWRGVFVNPIEVKKVA